MLEPDTYASLLYRLGFAEPAVRMVVYPHVLAGPAEVIEWMKGTLLTEYARHLPADLYDRFVAEYQERLLPQLEDTRPFFFRSSGYCARRRVAIRDWEYRDS